MITDKQYQDMFQIGVTPEMLGVKEMIREQVWNEWMKLKEEIQQLAGVVQNDIELTESDWLDWLDKVNSFKFNFNAVQRATMRLKK